MNAKKLHSFSCLALLWLPLISLADKSLTQPLAASDLVFEETDGLVVVEAEHFFKQEKDDVRAWYLTTADKEAGLKPDAEGNSVAGASGGAYLEILPDTRKNHGEKLIGGENFQNTAGKMAVLSYKVHFNTPGKYYVWARIYSSNTEDNGLHVGLNGTWPASGQRMQWTGKRHWVWGSKQRTEKVHTGVPGILFLNIDKAGEHIIQFSMREDGTELDQWCMTTDPKFKKPDGPLKMSKIKSGTPPKPFKWVDAPAKPTPNKQTPNKGASVKPVPERLKNAMVLADFPTQKRSYIDKDKWFAVDPEQHKNSTVTGPWPFNTGTFDITLHAVGENDGQSSYSLSVEGEKVGDFTCPLSKENFEEDKAYSKTFKNVRIDAKAMVTVNAAIGSADGKEFSRARWSHLSVAPSGDSKLVRKMVPAAASANAASPAPSSGGPAPVFTDKLFGERGTAGDGSVTISGELSQWHKVMLTLDGPFAHEQDNAPNPFTDMRFDVAFTHSSGSPAYVVPGYFAADGNAGESSADAGSTWRACLAPDKAGTWTYDVRFHTGADAALNGKGNALAPYHGLKGSFDVSKTDKPASGRDLRGKGRLQYVGQHHLQFAGSKQWFVKAGADAPETFLGYVDFDGTVAGKKRVPLKTWRPHLKDWNPGDPTWKGGSDKDKGKGMIGAVNYLSGKGCNVFSFLTYNAGGDGDNVWPFVDRNDPLNYDCSKLDQWGIVFDHATAKGMYLHFKLQETENDDNNRGKQKGNVPTALDGGELGRERTLYCREIVARYAHNLALNWNLGEENTQTTTQQRDMASAIAAFDPYDHLIVVHTYPDQQEKIYRPLLGDGSVLRGASLQNSNIRDCHKQVVKWTQESRAKGKPWVIGFDEPGNASVGMPADPGYPGMPDNFNNPSIDDTRKFALWGSLMAGGAGVEYYFGYKLPQNDLVCEDWRSRDKSWDYCRHALEFFGTVPVGEMRSMDEWVGNADHDNSAYCLAKPDEVILVYLPNGGSRELDLKEAKTNFNLTWFNPRNGIMAEGSNRVKSGEKTTLNAPDNKADWLAVLRAVR